jgi:hypothetical protein
VFVNLSLTAKILWAAGFLLNAALLFVLLKRRRFRTVPWFTGWIGFHVLFTVIMFTTYRFGSKHVYAVLYWSEVFLDLLLQIAVVLEIAGAAMRRKGRWVEGARVELTVMGGIAPVVALLMAWLMTPAAETRLDMWVARGSLFTTVLVVLLFSAVVIASQRLGLGWRNHIMRESYGFILWTVVAFATDALHAYWRTLGHFTALEDIRIAVFQAASVYWMIAFWLPENAPAAMDFGASGRLNDLATRL